MMTTKQMAREARRLFHFCLVSGTLDEGRVHQVVIAVIQSKRRGYLTLLRYFQRLLRLDRAQHTAKIHSAEPLSEDLQTNVQTDLERAYGRGLTTEFALNPALIGGMRIQVGSDVYDRSVQAGIAELKKRFGIISANGRNEQS